MAKPRVGIVSTDWSGLLDAQGKAIPGGANYIRLMQWLPHVSFTVHVGTLVHHPVRGFGVVDDRGSIHHDLNVLLMQRYMFRDVKYLLRNAKKHAKRPVIINDLDDWYWGLSEANAAWKTCQPTTNPTENINHYAEILRLSDVVTVSTPFLKDQMERWLGHEQVIQVDNCVDVDSFAARQHKDRRPVVGWVGSTAHRSNDLEEIQGLLPVASRVHHTGAMAGAPSFVKALGLDDSRVTVLPAMSPQQYARSGFPFDIGVAPLSDIPFNQGKSWIKLIEYAAAGVPFIASPRAEYIRLHETYGIGRIAHTRDEWTQHFQDLARYQTRATEAKRNRKIVSDELDVTVMAAQWDHLIRSLV